MDREALGVRMQEREWEMVDGKWVRGKERRLRPILRQVDHDHVDSLDHSGITWKDLLAPPERKSIARVRQPLVMGERDHMPSPAPTGWKSIARVCQVSRGLRPLAMDLRPVGAGEGR